MNIDKLTVREAARRRIPLDGANAQALEGALSMTERERDEARAEVERLRARVRSVDRSTAYEGTAFSDGESSQEDLAVVASERDEARSERERLRRERDYALAEVSRRDREHDALVETAQKALASVAAERDEARAEVERLRALLPPSAHTGVRNGPGEGSWAVFAEKVVAERDELRHKLDGEAAHIRSLEGLLVEATRERDEARAEIEMLRGVGCREAKLDEPESGPCGVCLKCAEERGARWALERHGNPFATKTLAQYAEEICKDARGKT